MFGRLRSLLLAPFRRNMLSRAIDDEFALHLDLRTEDLIRRGLAPDEARRRARMEFGNLTAAKETARASWGTTWVDRFERDLRYAIRNLRRNPGFTAIAVLSLGFGIGTTTTAFSVIDALDFRPLPFADADRLVWLAEVTPPVHEICSHCSWLTSPPTAREWAQATSFESVAAMTSAEVSLDHDDVTESLRGARATPGFFGVLGVRPVFGREFVATDTARGASAVALVSYEFWQTRLGASRDVLGTPLATGGNSPRPIIIGVLPQHFRFGSDRSVWLPLTMDGSSRANRWLTVVARLGPGQTIGRANVELKTIAERLAAAYPSDYHGWDVRVESLRTLITMPAGKARFALFATTVLVLLIAVLNVAGLLLGRAVARRHELAMRSALGASRASLLHQMLVEGSCIGVGGGVLSMLLAQWFIQFVPRWFSVDTIGLPVDVNARVLAFAAVVSILVGLCAAALPAVRIAAMNVNGTLRANPADTGIQGSRISNALITLQIALGLVLLTTAALMSRDFLELRYLDLGYRPDSLYFTSISGVAGASRDPAAWTVVAEEMRSRVAALPGIVSASLEHQNAMHPAIVRPEGGVERRDSNVTPVVKAVDLNYFETFGTRLVSGRSFGAGDAPGASLVAIINKAAAAVFWPGRSPLGQRVFVGDSASGGELLTVIGVVTNAERGELFQRHWPMLYRPFRQGRIYHAAARLYVRAGDDNPAVLAAAERAIRETTNQKTIPFASDEEKLNNGLIGRRVAAIALDVFAAFGLLLAAMGIYGSVNYAAKRRAREIGIRMALGARRWGVVGLVARRGVLLALAGSAAGVIGALSLMKVFKASALTTTVATPWILAGSVLLMVVVVLVATLLPAARATRVDVVSALRAE